MAAAAGWLADPSGSHELRYWDGQAWTEHVADAGTAATDPLLVPHPDPVEGPPTVPPAPPVQAADAGAAQSGGKVSWKDKLKQAADSAVTQGKQAAAQAKEVVAEQGAKRTAAWAEDPSTLWWGESKDATTSATGMAKARYRVTKHQVQLESGLLGTRSKSVPLWAVKDMDVRRADGQQGEDVGDVVLTLEDPTYGVGPSGRTPLTGVFEPSTTSGQVVLHDVEDPQAVLDVLGPLVSEARHNKIVERQSTYLHVDPGSSGGIPMPAAAPAGPPVDLADQLRKLADLRDEGILTQEEFETQKGRLLG